MNGVMFMQPEPQGLFSWWSKPGSPGVEVLLVIGIALVLAVLFFIWAAYVRSPRRKHHPRRHRHRSYDEKHRESSGVDSLVGAKRRRRRLHRRERPTNPTLAQVGGLPPRRDENQPPP